MTTGAFDISRTYAHLGLGSRVDVLEDFSWTEEYLAAYEAERESDGDEGRLVMIGKEDSTWSQWERHPAGDELVILLSGQIEVIQDLGDTTRSVALRAGEAVVNPRGVWHTADVAEAGSALFVTPGRGTEHRPRDSAHPGV